jgi:hypothetical protein
MSVLNLNVAAAHVTAPVHPRLTLPLTPAQVYNARYNTSASVFVSAKQRINQYCQAVPGAQTELEHIIKKFKIKNPNLTSANMRLSRAEKGRLIDIRIDDTMNRPLNWKHVLKILENFHATRVLAVNVYEDPNAPGCYIAWDGQHTTIVLYVIYCMIFEESASDVLIPIVIADPATTKAEIRENFINLNTEEKKGGGKVNLDPMDLFAQKVFGVRMDGSSDPDWGIAEQKQALLESANLFLTSAQHQNTGAYGAITQVVDIVDEELDIVENFCKYWQNRVVYQNQHVENKELIMINAFFKACKEQGITVTNDFIRDMTEIFWNTFECEFVPTKGLNIFWSKLDKAYKNWYNKNFPEPKDNEPDLRPKLFDMTKGGNTTHQITYGVTFMTCILRKHSFAHALPKPLVNFTPAKSDIW